ncbi:hypothetical protein [Flavobacterium selenitireducens]|uniref:hypothetical protein n=1 Tax=Flavobacterium selenitireducens TaxID=2722704 RepID=UPI00168C01D7|nr:hypothetical protein [Flavobacterium selenitireducens]MBD3581567.1 hypothetical protein [Flavobacterium selenitireducens]
MRFSIIILIFGALSCSTSKSANKIEIESSILSSKAVGKRHKTQNSYNPYIYENGYASISVVEEIITLDTLHLKVNKVKFNAVLGANYTQAAMFQKFGKWNREIFMESPQRGSLPAMTKVILIWDSVKLLPNNETLFNIFCEGDENMKEIYASAMVFDSKYNDQLKMNVAERELIINTLGESIQNLKSTNSFNQMIRQLIMNYKKQPKI